jgi:nitroreductase
LYSEDAKTMARLIKERVSIRSYLPDPVSKEDLDLVLEAGRRSPSGENAQPWKFIVVQDEKSRQIIGDLARIGSGRRFTGEFINKTMEHRFEGLDDPVKKKAVFDKLTSGSVSAFLAEAPLLIVVIGDKGVWDTPFDCSAAIENMLLQAQALQLGACWVNAITMDIRDELILKDLLAIPEKYKTLSVLALGYPTKMRGPRKRLTMEEIVCDEKFGKAYVPGGSIDV